jgi:eukaryotic-like serine/threonine-protein kinase
MRRFIREAKAASSLNHQNIITVHEIGEADRLQFIATELLMTRRRGD